MRSWGSVTDATLLRDELAAAVALRRTFAIISHPDAGKSTLTEKVLLYTGAIDRALEPRMDPFPFDQSPNLWWPDDRAWFVATEIDFDSTFVGGEDRLIAGLVTDRRLEALPITLSTRADAAADRVNATLNAQQ